MAPFTEIVAAVVAHSSAVALSHFGVVIEPAKTEPTSTGEILLRRSTSRATLMPRSIGETWPSAPL